MSFSFKKHTKKVLALTTVVLLCLGLSPIVVKPLVSTFVLNRSDSAPKGIYKIAALQSVRRGTLVELKLPPEFKSFASERWWLSPYSTLLKSIAGVPGDEVCITEKEIALNGESFGPVFVEDRNGKPLPKLRGCFTVSPGHYVLFSNHTPYSFDSRYFGEVSEELFIGEAKPIFTF